MNMEKEASKVKRMLPPETREKILEILREGISRRCGYIKIWKMLQENGIDVSKSTVRHYYYKHFSKRLGSKGRFLPRKLRIEIYQKVLELRKQGLGHRRIKRIIKELYGVAPSSTTILDWYRGKHSPYNGCRIPSMDFLEPSPELAYVIGVVAGDGFAIRNKKISGRYIIGASVKDQEFIEEFARCLGKILNRSPPRPILEKDGLFTVQVGSKALYELLRKPIDIDKISRFVEHCEDCIRSFLKGFFDSEAMVQKGKGAIYCYNTDIKLLKYIRRLLYDYLNIRTTGPNKATIRKEETNKDEYYIYIKAPDRLKFYQLIGFVIKRKQQRLIEENLPKLIMTKLYEKVLELRKQGLGYSRIKKEVERLYGITLGRTTIYNWCKGLHTPFALKRTTNRGSLENQKSSMM